jgi:hypothetical protein
LLSFLTFHHTALLAASHGLTEEQARCTPTVSTMCIGGLIKHLTTMQWGWTLTVTPPSDSGGTDSDRWRQWFENLADQHTVHHDESLDGLLAAYRAQNVETIRVFADADLDAAAEVPPSFQAAYSTGGPCEWTVRWVLLHIIEEFTRHAGHADIIRESIDGATMYELLFALEGL